MTTLMKLSHLQKSFGKQRVLRDVNLKLNEGEIMCLLGPSGAGKSTTIMTSLGIEKADSGKTILLGQKMPNRPILGKIGYMAQSDALYPDLTCRENLRFFGQLKGMGRKELKQEILHVTQVVGLTTNLDKKVGLFSGGMKRRVSLAIAMLGKPQLLVLDEPTVGIDPLLKKHIWQEFYHLRDRGCGLLVTTHVMDEAEKSDLVAFLFNGEVKTSAKPTIIKQHYQVNSIEDAFLKAESEAEK